MRNILTKETIEYIRLNKDELTKRDWAFYSCKIDFTADELREFQDYIDWHCYYVYCSKKCLTTKQLLEFKEKDEDWVMIFEYRYLGEDLLRRYIEIPKFSFTSWRYVFDKQKVGNVFRGEYGYLTKKK